MLTKWQSLVTTDELKAKLLVTADQTRNTTNCEMFTTGHKMKLMGIVYKSHLRLLIAISVKMGKTPVSCWPLTNH